MELIIYIAISSIMVVMLLKIMLNVVDNREKTEVLSAVTQDLRHVAMRIEHTGYDAINVQTGATLFNTASGSITFTMSGTTVNPTVYFLSGNAVYFQAGTSPALQLTDSSVDINQLLFTDRTSTGSTTTIQFEIIAEQLPGTSAQTYTGSGSIRSSFSIRR